VDESFTADEKAALLSSLTTWIKEAQHWAHFYQAWDITFKVLVTVLAVAAAFGSAAVASHYKRRAPLWLIIFNTSASALIAALSAFAFTQLNFSSRERTYETKDFEFGSLRDQLTYYSHIKKADVFEKLRIIHSWGDTNPAPPGGLADKHSTEQAELRTAQNKLLRIRSASAPLLDERGVISQLPNDSPQKETLLRLASQLKESLSDDDGE
jgi:hypothetical protein